MFCSFLSPANSSLRNTPNNSQKESHSPSSNSPLIQSPSNSPNAIKHKTTVLESVSEDINEVPSNIDRSSSGNTERTRI